MRHHVLPLIAATLTLAACDAVGPASAPSKAGSSPDTQASAATPSALSAVRRATAAYHRVDEAVADGWGAVVISECVAHPELGGMGHHYVNLGLMDGELDPVQPEVLLYEPTKNGRLQLVGVEYVVPFGVVPETGPAPELFGQTFHPSAGAGGWALHAWVWRHNPAGLFADFNPTVSCDDAS
ncbi:hypothetical protein [Rubrivirga marina]|uniref:hypothetical protein n=1 Tax=Rubrivirga marina TaxID=1196024 RepID=UPI000BA9839F|nr:hypothetical protein [Rubrivirga marina]